MSEARENRDKEQTPSLYWSIFWDLSPLCGFSASDLQWLYKDLDNCKRLDDKRIILSAIVNVLKSEDQLDAENEILRKKLKAFPVLIEDLKNYLIPHEEQDWHREHRLRNEEFEKKRITKEQKNRDSWKKFRDEIVDDPFPLSNHDKYLQHINNLTHWLKSKTKQGPEKAPRQWQLIQKAFSAEVALAYRDAMKALWRTTNPDRPHRKGSHITPERTNIYSYAGVGIEADENPHWATMLTKEEAVIAAKHGCMYELGYPDWLDELLDIHSGVVLPIVEKTFRAEWKSKHDGIGYLLYRYGNETFPIHSHVAPSIFEIIVRSEPYSLNRLNYGLQILQRMDFSENQIKRLEKMAITKFDHYMRIDEHKFAIQYISLMFQVAPQSAIKCLKNCLESANGGEQAGLDLKIFASFNKDRRRIDDPFINTPVNFLKDLVLLAYRYIKRSEDNVHEGVYSPSLRDDAESGRNTILSALLKRKGPEAYQSMIELAEMPEIKESAHRFRQLARGMAERDSEFLAWTEDEIIKFEKKYIAPIKTGKDLYRVVLSVLDEIRYQLEHEDVSSKCLLKSADGEESIQNWVAEHLGLRSKGRYQVFREAEVANKNKPDIIIPGITVPVEVAIEVKQADSWSPNELKKALTKQLAEDYLKPMTRRHGVLFLTDHGRRKWRHPHKTKKLTFDMLVEFLSKEAMSIDNNSTGHVQVSVFGIDAT